MRDRLHRRDILRLGAGLSALALLSACDTTGFNIGQVDGNRRLDNTPSPGAQSFGTGPVRVALLLPLSGDPALAGVGISMADAAQLAMDYIAASPKIGDNITLVLKDTGPTANGAAQRAREAVSEGASLMLGPLKGDQVEAAGAVAKAANIPLIGFSNNAAAASPGVYLLNVLPDVEVHRSLVYATGHGRKNVAAIFPNSDFGRNQQAAYDHVMAQLGLTSRGSFLFGSDAESRNAVGQAAALIQSGAVDTLFLPDRASAPGLAAQLQQAGILQGKVLLVGSADWDTDASIAQTPYLVGAVYPAVDDTGFQAMKPDFIAKFGTSPHPLSTIAYTATILANASALSMTSPRYTVAELTLPGGFNGRDGVFRFLPDGRSEYALIMKQLVAGGAQRVDGPKL